MRIGTQQFSHCLHSLKETVHLKIIIDSSSSRSKPVWMCLNVDTKEDILKKVCFRAPKNTVFHIMSSFVFRTNTCIQVWIYDDLGCTVPLRLLMTVDAPVSRSPEQTHAYRFGSMMILGCTVPLRLLMRVDAPASRSPEQTHAYRFGSMMILGCTVPLRL